MERFEKFIAIMPDTCWVWTGSVNRKGYGSFRLNGKLQAAHRVSYELYVGTIPEGLHIDHLCRKPGCVNPSHLEPVTPGENTLRAYKANLVPCKHGVRLKSQCKPCKKQYLKTYYKENRDRLLAKQNNYYKESKNG